MSVFKPGFFVLPLLELPPTQAPRLPEQPIFYPVLNEEYAVQIARDWNVPASGAGYVTRFRIWADFARRYPVQIVGGSVHQELWVPAGELDEFNANLVGSIEVIAEFHGTGTETLHAGH